MRSFCEKYGKNTPFHAVAKQLFGRKYERISRSLMLCLILFLAVYASELRVQVSPAVLYLTAAVFSAGIMWRVLNSTQNAEIFMGLFMLPFDDREMMISYAAAFGGYTLITKTAVVLALFFAAAQWSAAEIGAAVLLACNAGFLAILLLARFKWKAAGRMDKEFIDGYEGWKRYGLLAARIMLNAGVVWELLVSLVFAVLLIFQPWNAALP